MYKKKKKKNGIFIYYYVIKLYFAYNVLLNIVMLVYILIHNTDTYKHIIKLNYILTRVVMYELSAYAYAQVHTHTHTHTSAHIHTHQHTHPPHTYTHFFFFLTYTLAPSTIKYICTHIQCRIAHFHCI